MKHFLTVAVICFTCGIMQGDTTSQKSKESGGKNRIYGSRPPTNPEFHGESYHPKKQDIHIPSDIANWSLLSFKNGEIKKIRMVGFDGYNGGKPLDVVSDDRIDLETCEYALHQAAVLRLGIPDFGRGGGGVGGGAHLGVIQVDTGKRKMIVGVSMAGFFLNTFHGSSRQTFYSWALAKQVDDLLFKATKKQLLTNNGYVRNVGSYDQ